MNRSDSEGRQSRLKQEHPTFRTEIPLSGYSGARVSLIRDGTSEPYVRKVSNAVQANARLSLQASKQRQLGKILTKEIQVPRVIREGEHEGLYFFDMEYVLGINGATFLRTASFPDIAKFTSALTEGLTVLATTRIDDERSFSPRADALQKCYQLHAGTTHLQVESRCAIDRLIYAVEHWEMPAELTPTLNHGDMTLENIIVDRGGQIYLIDMLDSYIDHWVTDLSKLDQDLYAGWYMRSMAPIALSVVHFVRKQLRIASGVIDGGVANQMTPLFLCINIARILPYCQVPEDREFVLQRLNSLLACLGKPECR